MNVLSSLKNMSQRRPWLTFAVGLAACALVGMAGVYWGFDIAVSGFYLTV